MPATKTNAAERAGATTSSGRKSDLPLVVVAGATGHIGSQVVKELVKSGKFRVRAIVRPKKDEKPSSASAASATPATSSSSAVAARLSKLGAEIWHGDVTEPATIAGCCEGASAAVSALGVRSFDRRDGSVWSVDRDGTLAFFEQARLAAVAATSSTPPSSSSAAAAPSSLPPPAVLRVFVMVATFEGKESRRAEAISEAKEEAVDRVVAAARAMEAAARGAAASSAGAAVVSGGGGRHENP